MITVGASTSARRVGAVVTRYGPRLEGAMAATAPVGPARLVLGADAAAPDASQADARVCAPGSLDARAVHDAVVLCERGGVPRIEKSRTVRLADGAGMVLVNTRGGSTDADLHEVPTVHLSARDGRALRAWARQHRRSEVRLVSIGRERRPARVARFSSGGDPTWSVIKPDLVAPGHRRPRCDHRGLGRRQRYVGSDRPCQRRRGDPARPTRPTPRPRSGPRS